MEPNCGLELTPDGLPRRTSRHFSPPILAAAFLKA
jgi:hypothetical protein